MAERRRVTVVLVDGLASIRHVVERMLHTAGNAVPVQAVHARWPRRSRRGRPSGSADRRVGQV
jgi:hypothetical protein